VYKIPPFYDKLRQDTKNVKLAFFATELNLSIALMTMN